MIIDLHTYVGNSMLGLNGSVEELLESMEKNGKEWDYYFTNMPCKNSGSLF